MDLRPSRNCNSLRLHLPQPPLRRANPTSSTSPNTIRAVHSPHQPVADLRNTPNPNRRLRTSKWCAHWSRDHNWFPNISPAADNHNTIRSIWCSCPSNIPPNNGQPAVVSYAPSHYWAYAQSSTRSCATASLGDQATRRCQERTGLSVQPRHIHTFTSKCERERCTIGFAVHGHLYTPPIIHNSLYKTIRFLILYIFKMGKRLTPKKFRVFFLIMSLEIRKSVNYGSWLNRRCISPSDFKS